MIHGLTHAGDPLGDQVLQQSVNDRVVSGVQLVSINPNVETEPIRVGVSRQLPGGAELVHVALGVPEVRKKRRVVRCCATVHIHCVISQN